MALLLLRALFNGEHSHGVPRSMRLLIFAYLSEILLRGCSFVLEIRSNLLSGVHCPILYCAVLCRTK